MSGVDRGLETELCNGGSGGRKVESEGRKISRRDEKYNEKGGEEGVGRNG